MAEADRVEWRLWRWPRPPDGLLSGVGVVLKLRSLSANLRIWLTVNGACRATNHIFVPQMHSSGSKCTCSEASLFATSQN